jgi:hypothetical protein
MGHLATKGEEQLPGGLEAEPVLGGLAYAAILEAPAGWVMAQEFQVAPERGLLQVEVLHEPTDGAVGLITHWANREAHDVHRGWLTRELGFEGKPRVAGLVAEVLRARKPWWKRLPLYGLAMGALGFLGTLELARARYGLFFGSPDMEVRAAYDEAINVSAGSPARVAFSAINHSRIVTASLRQVEVSYVPSQGGAGAIGIEATVPSTLGPIAPGGDAKAEVQLGAAAAPGDYQVTVRYEVKGGVFQPAEEDVLEIPVRVWPELEIGNPQLDLGATGARVGLKHSWANVRVRAGGSFPRGLECSAELLRTSGVSLTGATSKTLGLVETNRGTVDAPGAEVAFLEWSTSSVGPFETRNVLIGVHSDKPREDWDELVGQLKARCFRRRDGQ